VFTVAALSTSLTRSSATGENIHPRNALESDRRENNSLCARVPCTREYIPLCASSGVTYANRCLFRMAQCYNPSLYVTHNGDCRPDCISSREETRPINPAMATRSAALPTLVIIAAYCALVLADAPVALSSHSLLGVSPANASSSGRRLSGLGCDLQIFHDFISSDPGQDVYMWATLCESRIVYLKNKRAGKYGPVEQADLRTAMCSPECLKSDELHQVAISKSRCTCAELSADTFVQHDFCLENSARLLCTHLRECGHWNCPLEDFNCLRYEWDRYYACEGMSVRWSIGVALMCYLLCWLVLNKCNRGYAAWGYIVIDTAMPMMLMTKSVVEWVLFADASKAQRIHQGTIVLDGAVDESTQSRAGAVEWSSLVLEQARRLVQQDCEQLPATVEFELQLQARADGNASDHDSNNKALWCQLQVVERAADDEGGAGLSCDAEDWLGTKVARANAYKLRANEAFRASKYRTALTFYKRALRWLAAPTNCVFDDKQRTAVEPLVITCHVNVATCLWKLEQWDKCASACTKALDLDANHVKALFRRAQVRLKAKDFDSAVADLEHAFKIEPTNKHVGTELDSAIRQRIQFKNKAKKAYAGMFAS
ncbi:TPA: hypothetical protein N0F65_002428, partial [Lagenidium giganteum]